MSASIKLKSEAVVAGQLAQVEAALGQPLWLESDLPSASGAKDLEEKYSFKYKLYLNLLRKLAQPAGEDELEASNLGTDAQRQLLILINNFERFGQSFELEGSSFELRPDQKELFESFINALQLGDDKIWGKLPTGYGKTIVAAFLAAIAEEPSVIAVPRKALIKPLQNALAAICPERSISVFYGDKKDVSGDTVIILYQSNQAFNEAARAEGRSFPLVIGDEIHLGITKKKLANLFNIPGSVCHFGMTATPEYSEDRTVGHHFGKQIYEMTIVEGIELGILSNLRSVFAHTNIDISGVAIRTSGQYNEAQLIRALDVEERNAVILSSISSDFMQGIGSIAFCLSIAHANKLAQKAKELGVTAAAIHSDMRPTEINNLIEAFERGEIDFLATPKLLGIGWDSKRVQIGWMAAPRRGRVEKEQEIGRLVRILQSDTMKLIIELADDDRRQGIITAPMITGGRAMVLRPGDQSESVKASDEFLEKLSASLKNIGIRLATSEEEVLAVANQLNSHAIKMSAEEFSKILETVPKNVIEGLRQGDWKSFLSHRFTGPDFYETGRTLVRLYYSHVYGRRINRITSDAVYDLVTELMVDFEQYGGSDQAVRDTYRGLLANAGIHSRQQMLTMGYQGFLGAFLPQERNSLNGRRFLASYLRKSRAEVTWPLNRTHFDEMVVALFGAEEDPKSAEVMEEERRLCLRSLFKEQRLTPRHIADMSVSSVLNKTIVVGKTTVPIDGLIKEHFTNALGVDFIQPTVTQTLAFIQYLFPEDSDVIAKQIANIEDRHARKAKGVIKDLDRCREVVLASGITPEKYLKYGPYVVLGARFADKDFTGSGLRVIRDYFRIKKIWRKRAVTPQDVDLMMLDLFPTMRLPKPIASPLVQLQNFLAQTEVTPSWVANSPLSRCIHTTVTHDDLRVPLGQLVHGYFGGERGQDRLKYKDFRRFFREVLGQAPSNASRASSQTDAEEIPLSKTELRELFEALGFTRNSLLRLGSTLFINGKIDDPLYTGTGRSLIQAVLNTEKFGTTEINEDIYRTAVAILFPSDTVGMSVAPLEASEFELYLVSSGISREEALRRYPNLLVASMVKVEGIQVRMTSVVRRYIELHHPERVNLGTHENIPIFVNAVFSNFDQDLEKRSDAVTEVAGLLTLDMIRALLSTRDIRSCEKLLTYDPLQFARLRFKSERFTGYGLDLCAQTYRIAGINVPYTNLDLELLAQILFPDEVEKTVAILDLKELPFSVVKKFIQEAARTPLAEMDTVSFTSIRSARNREKTQYSGLSMLKRFHEAGYIPDNDPITEEDLLTIARYVEKRRMNTYLVEWLKIQRLLVPLRKEEILGNAVREQFSTPITFDSFCKQKVKVASFEFSGKDVAFSLRINDDEDLTAYLGQTPKEQGASDESPRTNKLLETVIGLVEQYDGEEGDNFATSSFDISGKTIPGEDLVQILVDAKMIEPEQPVTPQVLSDIVEGLNIGDPLKNALRDRIIGYAILSKMDGRELLRVFNSAHARYGFGQGPATDREIMVGEPMPVNDVQVPPRVIAQFIQKNFGIAVSQSDWQIKLLPKVLRWKGVSAKV